MDKLNMMLISTQHGMTLTELMVVIVIMGIIASIAAPSIQQWLYKHEAQQIQHTLVNALTLAKSESYITHQSVLFCLSNGGGRCNRNSSQELLLFEDNNHNKQFDTASDRLILKEALSLKYGNLKLRASARRHYVKFFGDTGKPRGHFGHIKYCPLSLDTHLMF